MTARDISYPHSPCKKKAREKARKPDPMRLFKAYSQSASTLNLLRAFSQGGFADLKKVHLWNLGFVNKTFEGKKFKEIEESIVIGQAWKNDIRIILFVVLNKGFSLNDKIKNKMKKTIRANASPRHVPSKIISIREIPKTKNAACQ